MCEIKVILLIFLIKYIYKLLLFILKYLNVGYLLRVDWVFLNKNYLNKINLKLFFNKIYFNLFF